MVNDTMDDDDIIGLERLWKAISKYKKRIFLSTIVATALAYFLTMQFAPQWEATALLQVGQTPSSVANQSLPDTFESPNIMVSRMNRPAFEIGMSQYVREVGLDFSPSEAALFRNSFKVSVAKSSDLIEIKLRAHTPESAIRLIQEVVMYAKLAQQSQFTFTVQNLRERKEAIAKDVQSSRNLYNALDKQLQLARTANERLFAGVLLQQKADQLRGLEESERRIEEKLSPLRTFETKYIGEIYVSEEPVYPKPILVSVLVFIMSVLVGIVVAALVHRRRA